MIQNDPAAVEWLESQTTRVGGDRPLFMTLVSDDGWAVGWLDVIPLSVECHLDWDMLKLSGWRLLY